MASISLYAWVDRNRNRSFEAGEPAGFYRSLTNPNRAQTIHMRSEDVGGIDFSIP